MARIFRVRGRTTWLTFKLISKMKSANANFARRLLRRSKPGVSNGRKGLRASSDEQLANDLGKIVRTGKAKKIRPTSKAMQDAVKLLIERERIPRHFHEVALKISQAIGLFGPDPYPDRLSDGRICQSACE